jgi:hypothetical protein
MPALRSDWQPMMLRVRPAQLTTTSVSGIGREIMARDTQARRPVASTPPGMFIRWYSS